MTEISERIINDLRQGFGVEDIAVRSRQDGSEIHQATIRRVISNLRREGMLEALYAAQNGAAVMASRGPKPCRGG